MWSSWNTDLVLAVITDIVHADENRQQFPVLIEVNVLQLKHHQKWNSLWNKTQPEEWDSIRDTIISNTALLYRLWGLTLNVFRVSIKCRVCPGRLLTHVHTHTHTRWSVIQSYACKITQKMLIKHSRTETYQVLCPVTARFKPVSLSGAGVPCTVLLRAGPTRSGLKSLRISETHTVQVRRVTSVKLENQQ